MKYNLYANYVLLLDLLTNYLIPKKLFVPMSDNFTREPIGFALRKGDYDALNFFNNWILNAHASGFLAEREAYWFKSRDWADQVK